LTHDFIVPVPVTYKDMVKKGFYHTYLIAKILSHRYHVPVIKDLVVKVKQTRPQSVLKRKERLINLKNAFKVKKKYEKMILNKKLLIFDDVYTTGSTIQEISKELSRHKVRSINVLTLARGR